MTRRFLMDFDGGGKWEVHGKTGAACRRERTYTAGIDKAVNCLTDMGPGDVPLNPYKCHSYAVTATP